MSLRFFGHGNALDCLDVVQGLPSFVVLHGFRSRSVRRSYKYARRFIKISMSSVSSKKQKGKGKAEGGGSPKK